MTTSPLDALAEFKARHRLTDQGLAEKLGTSRTVICRIRKARRRPSLDLAAKIEDVTKIPAAVWATVTLRDGAAA